MASRRPRTHAVQFVFLLGVYFLVLVQWPSLERGLSPAQIPDQARDVFLRMMEIAFFGIALLVPALAATAISVEKESNTLPILLLSETSGFAIVLAKALFRVFFIAVLMALISPMVAGLMAVGGIETLDILRTLLVLFAFAFLATALSLGLSVVCGTGRAALLSSYVVLFALVFIVPFPLQGSRFAHLASAHDTLRYVLQPQLYDRESLNPTLWWANPLACTVLAVFALILAGAYLPAVAFPSGPTRREGVRRASEGVTGNAFRWLEVRSGLLERIGPDRVLIVSGLVLGAAYFLLWKPLQLMEVQRVLVPLMLTVLSLAATVLAATSVTLEREKGSFVVLATTPVDGETYLKGKLLGMMRNLLPLTLIPAFHLAVFSLAGVFPWYLVLTHMVLIAASLPLFIVQGLYCSFATNTSTRAIVLAVTVVLVEILVTAIPGLSGCLPLFPPVASFLLLDAHANGDPIGGLVVAQVVAMLFVLIVPIAVYRSILVTFDRKLGRAA